MYMIWWARSCCCQLAKFLPSPVSHTSLDRVHCLRAIEQPRPIAKATARAMQNLQIVPDQEVPFFPVVVVRVAMALETLPHVAAGCPMLPAARIVQPVRVERQVEAWLAGARVQLQRLVHVRHAERRDVLLRRRGKVADPLVRNCERRVRQSVEFVACEWPSRCSTGPQCSG
eukprot:gnl/MRDRNA2_/MRDRNA2_84481_c0_seq1.p1 gnl/MRDRNA2_/MRDRNA2_84481_c0~~gnl/MRDRNA2_/MRDRNA2_84481_c0_seq1.p1  ORF type:complete len:172 (-),score=2.39 gnl/MRDRNA2_/MRDRNA2_84481_c0_seq1:21-536(-)